MSSGWGKRAMLESATLSSLDLKDLDEISEYHDGSASAKLTEMYKRLETTKNRAESETILDSELLQSDVCQDFADIIEYHLKKAQQYQSLLEQHCTERK